MESVGRIVTLRLAVVALDGYPFHLLRETRRSLPNISSLIEGGSWGRLQSTIPYVTSTAWSSFITGLNPGKHGVVGFFRRKSGNPIDTGALVAGNSINGTSLWKRLSEQGVTVGVLGVPMTYRPEKVNGFMVSGFPLPPDARNYTFPDQLGVELEGKGWRFSDIPTQSYSKNRLEPFYDELKARVVQKTDAVLYLTKKYDPDFFMVHYFETDKLLHEFLNFRYADKCGRQDFVQYHNFVDEFLSHLDRQLGRLFDLLPLSCDVILMSDHGLAAGNHLFMADTWLLQRRYLRLKRRLSTRLRYLIFRLGVTPEFGFRVAPRRMSGMLLRGFMNEYWSPDTGKKRRQPVITRWLYSVLLDKRKDVDWERSTAYSFGGYGVFNVYLREGLPEDEAKQIRQRLLSELATFTFDGRKVFDKVLRDEEVYVLKGERFDFPDIMAYDEQSEFVATSNPVFFTSNKNVTKKYANSNEANHDRGGIYVAKGPSIARRGLCADLDIEDIHPTILHILGLAIGSDVDGKVATEILEPSSEAANREPRFVEASAGQGASDVFSKKEETEITSKLREMGYI